jgi:signal transduction histidine kinase
MSWNYAYTPHIWPPFFTVFLLLALAIYSWRRRSVPGALPFAIGCLLTLPVASSIVMGYAAVDGAAKIFWFKSQAGWQLPGITAITAFILEYAWPGRWLTRRNVVLLAIVPLLLMGLALTNDLHHLIWSGFAVDESVIPQYGPLMWIFVLGYGTGLTLVNLTVFIWLLLRSTQHRWPVAIMLFTQMGSRVIFLLGSAVPDSWLFYLPEFAFPFIAYAIALFGFRIFDPISLAHRMAIEQLHDGILVLDLLGQVVNLNPSAERMLGLSNRRALGCPVKELLPAYPDLDLDATGRTILEFSLGTGPALRDYTLGISRMNDWRGLEVGRLLLLSDVTELKRAREIHRQQQLLLAMLNEREWLARELHDNLGQVFAFVNSQGQTVRRLLARGEVATADEYVARLVAVAREADVDIRESILGLRVSLAGQALYPALALYLERYEKNYAIHTLLDWPETLDKDAFEPQVEVQLLRILQEALTNARKHAEAHTVRVVFTVLDGAAQVAIQDDGKGFDPDQLLADFENHVGLRVMRERAEEAGGSLAVDSKPGEGTLITVSVPLRTVREEPLPDPPLKGREQKPQKLAFAPFPSGEGRGEVLKSESGE